MMDSWYEASSIDPSMLIMALRDPRLRWVYAERMEDTVLTWRDDFLDGEVDMQRWLHGRAFGRDLEVAWWTRGNGIDARAIVSEGSPPESVSWETLPTEGWDDLPEINRVLLVGERELSESGVWSTARVPRYLAYPIDDPQVERVELVQRFLRHNGLVIGSRLMEVREVRNE